MSGGFFNILQAPSDVDKTRPTDGQVLVWSTALNKWVPAANIISETDPLAIHQSVLTTPGDIVVRGATVAGRLPIGTANQVLHGGASVPEYSAVVEADISLSDNTTNNASLTKHGFLDTLPGGTTNFKRADGAWAAPASVAVPNGYVQEAFAYTANVAHSIVHNFGAYPVVQAFDSSGNMLIPYIIQNTSTNATSLTFSITGTYTVVLTIGSPPFSTITITAVDYTVGASDYMIKVTAADKFITLPTAVGRSGKIFDVKNASTGICDVIFTAGQNADGYTDVTIPSLDSYSFMSDGANWMVF